MTTRAGVLMQGRDHISHYSEYALSSNLSIYSTLIVIVSRDLMLRFPMPLLNFIYSMMELLICKHEPFSQGVSVESLILKWLLRHVGPVLNVKSLVYLNRPCRTTFCRWDYGLKEKYDSSIHFCRITKPAFHVGDLKGVTSTKLNLHKWHSHILNILKIFKSKTIFFYSKSNH